MTQYMVLSDKSEPVSVGRFGEIVLNRNNAALLHGSPLR